MRVYFDYNATTPLCQQALQAMNQAYNLVGNASSVHTEGRGLGRLLEEARTDIARMMGCKSSELFFTSGTTEGNNSVIHSAIQRNINKAIVTSAIEHNAINLPLENLRKQGYAIKEVPVNSQGVIDLNLYQQYLSDVEPALVSIMLANNETGMILPIKQMAEIAHRKNILFHTDAACSLGKLPIHFQDLGVDFLTASSHKSYGPVGAGILIIKEGVLFNPFHCGGSQEQGRRAGTVPVPLIAGFSSGIHFAYSDADENKRQWDLRAKIKTGLRKLYENISFHEASEIKYQLPGTLNVGFKGLSGQTLLANLDLEGVSASFGAACQSGTLEVSRVILAMGIDPLQAAGSIRLSFGKMTTENDVEFLLGAFERVLARM